MEHRCSERSAVNLDVMVGKPGCPLTFGRIVNSSKLGFFILMNPSQLNLFQMIDVEILYEQGNPSPYRHICSVCIIRKTAAGIGVEIESSRLEPTNIIPFSSPLKFNQPKQRQSDVLFPASNS